MPTDPIFSPVKRPQAVLCLRRFLEPCDRCCRSDDTALRGVRVRSRWLCCLEDFNGVVEVVLSDGVNILVFSLSLWQVTSLWSLGDLI